MLKAASVNQINTVLVEYIIPVNLSLSWKCNLVWYIWASVGASPISTA